MGIFEIFVVLPYMLRPPKPKIKNGEFPFRLTYELNGETITITDTAICEFDGYGELTEAGQYREWKTHLKSENDKLILKENKTDIVWITLLDISETNERDDFGNKILELYFFGGNGHYYMGDELGGHARSVQGFNYISYRYQNDEGKIGHSSLTTDEAFEKYRIRLISWEISEPIQNTFR